jgi:hypothetical protein
VTLPLDLELIETMNNLRDQLRGMIAAGSTPLNEEGMRCLIVSSNLRGLAEAMLSVDDAGAQPDLKKISLALLGTAEWLRGDIEIDKLGVK